ncbi:hypothetical protein L1987_15969 [Smallanthus sonchifolius]|uniref:Uncharacterized protein n=1 Tax=Smallanthus sonchifolius TaxID=185202 RepID=A0ACB9J812_9ASTR|nr:hypothetical protein L1987_15969 [Smallanthus sonchifolius]
MLIRLSPISMVGARDHVLICCQGMKFVIQGAILIFGLFEQLVNCNVSYDLTFDATGYTWQLMNCVQTANYLLTLR